MDHHHHGHRVFGMNSEDPSSSKTLAMLAPLAFWNSVAQEGI